MSVDRSTLVWPSEDDIDEGVCQDLNRQYEDMQGAKTSDVLVVLNAEAAFTASFAEHGDLDEALDVWEDALEGQCSDWFLLTPVQSLEPGVASLVAALACLGCLPFTSCNGGVFGGSHSFAVPHVCFFAQGEHLDALEPLAERAGVSLSEDSREIGAVVASSEKIEAMRAFALSIAQAGD